MCVGLLLDLLVGLLSFLFVASLVEFLFTCLFVACFLRLVVDLHISLASFTRHFLRVVTVE